MNMRLKKGAPDEPDDDLDAIGKGPHPEVFFAVLFKEVANAPLPTRGAFSDNNDPIRRVQTAWNGDADFGLDVTQAECPETTALPVYMRYETYGLPGMKVKWEYSLQYKGQLGHVIYRNGSLECTFDGEADVKRFTTIWRRIIGKEPVFEPVPESTA